MVGSGHRQYLKRSISKLDQTVGLIREPEVLLDRPQALQ
jgi:hypothetical protein